MKIFVSGCAGFIGNRLVEKALDRGYDVVGVDCFLENYDPAIKKNRIKNLEKKDRFQFYEMNLADLEGDLLDGVEWVFHVAGIPGVRTSWGGEFTAYLENNVLATQRLLELVKDASSVKKLVYSSSSSIYGAVKSLPVKETDLPRPYSPYGVTKLAGEHLLNTYSRNFGVKGVSLRYFTVYGPGQRPDMAFQRIIHAIRTRSEFVIMGDGRQSRDFTFVDDIVEANFLAAESSAAEGSFNIGGGSRISLIDVITLIEKMMGQSLNKKFSPASPGDVPHTAADISLARETFNYSPKISLEKGLSLQLAHSI